MGQQISPSRMEIRIILINKGKTKELRLRHRGKKEKEKKEKSMLCCFYQVGEYDLLGGLHKTG